MHLLATQSGIVDGNTEAVDLAQDPADIIIISAADSELAALANAHDTLDNPATLRLANQMALTHNLSVDTYIENTAAHTKLIIVRVLGGKNYWPYGVDQLTALANRNNIKLALLPGGNDPDTELTTQSTLAPDTCERIRQYLAHGGTRNAQNLLKFCEHLLDETNPVPPPPTELKKAGIFRTTDSPPPCGEGLGVGPFTIAIIFYRALIEGGLTAPVTALTTAIQSTGHIALPIFVTSLKDPDCTKTLHTLLAPNKPDIIINATGFATGQNNPFIQYDCPVLQTVFSGTSKEAWAENPTGLPARDLAMNIVLPELDGRIMTRAVSFKADHAFHQPTQCRIVTYEPVPDRIDFTVKLALNWARLRKTTPKHRKLAIILANYPNRDGRIGNGVGYDTPASTVNILNTLDDAGYYVKDIPKSSNALIERLQSGITNAHPSHTPVIPARPTVIPAQAGIQSVNSQPGTTANGMDSGLRRNDELSTFSLNQYLSHFTQLPQNIQKQITDRWGSPTTDPFFTNNKFHLSVQHHGNIITAIQPARGYNIDPEKTYHDPALAPPHGYLAFYWWLAQEFGAHAVIHNGKHGNLEWLPGKAVGLSKSCYPEIALGPMPQLYPFIVNDPGEGTQAKRRTSAVIIDHLTPPLTRAETYGPYRDLEALIDEYYLASGLDQRRLDSLKRQILNLTQTSGLDKDAGLDKTVDENEALQKLDTYICELKEAQIRDGLHILGQSPQGQLETDLLVALTRTARGVGKDGDQSIIRALATDYRFEGFDPFDCELGENWTGPKPRELQNLTPEPWRTNGDTVERLELMAADLVSSLPTPVTPSVPFVIPAKAGNQSVNSQPGTTANGMDSGLRRNDGGDARGGDLENTIKVLQTIATQIRPALQSCGPNEIANLLKGLNGQFVPPGPSGAPTRGRLDVLPTGKNFYSIDNRTIPTPTAWTLGQKSAENMLTRHFQDTGTYLKSIGLTVWGTSNMRTGGDDIAQALALIGAKPVWDNASWRVTGYEIIPQVKLARPRVDVTLRISGLFRDAFPIQIELFDKAIRDIGNLEEPEADNPIAARMKAEITQLTDNGLDAEQAELLSGHRIFGSKPGAYGAGLQALIDEKLWANRADFAAAYITWGSYAYGKGATGNADEAAFKRRLKNIEAVVHNQDNREHDLLDSDDYYQFEGGMSAAVEKASGGKQPLTYHNDHSRPEKPVTRTLEEEVGRVMRSRVTNPKWINGIKRHGYKGAFEIAATVDYMFAFAATTGAVKDHHFEMAYEAFLNDENVRDFISQNNPAALKEIAARFEEAISRNLWTPKSNSAYTALKNLMDQP